MKIKAFSIVLFGISVILPAYGAWAEDGESVSDSALDLYNQAFPEITNEEGRDATEVKTLQGLGVALEGITSFNLLVTAKVFQLPINLELDRLSLESVEAMNPGSKEILDKASTVQTSLNKTKELLRAKDNLITAFYGDLVPIAPSDRRQLEIFIQERDILQSQVNRLSAEFDEIESAARPIRRMLKEARAGALSVIKNVDHPDYPKMVKMMNWARVFRVAGYVLVADGAFRLANSLQGRDSNISPVYQLGAEAYDIVFSTDED